MQTPAYIGLTFAFGLARLGEGKRSRELEAAAAERLTPTGDPTHLHLLAAFRYRIADAHAGQPNAGPLPDLPEPAGLGQQDRYRFNQYRANSFVLEPDEWVDPYSGFQRGRDPFEEAVWQLRSHTDPARFRDEAQRLVAEAERRREPDLALTEPLTGWLPHAELAVADFAAQLLAGVHALAGRLRESRAREAPESLSRLLRVAYWLAVRLGRADDAFALAAGHFRPFLDTGNPAPFRDPSCPAALLALARTGERAGLASLFDLLSKRVAGGDWLALLRPTNADADWRPAVAVAGGWLYLGSFDQATPVLDAALESLTNGSGRQGGLSPLSWVELAAELALALTHAPLPRAADGLSPLLRRSAGLPSAFTTHTHYSRLHLRVAEAVVRAVAHDDFAPPDHRRQCGDAERRERAEQLARLYDAVPPLQC
jgi:hypothetical protein